MSGVEVASITVRGEEIYMRSLAVGLVLAFVFSAFAAQDTSLDKPQPITVENRPADAQLREPQILAELRETNRVFIKLGSLAREKGATLNLRRFGDRVMRDHTLSQGMISEYAHNHNLTVPMDSDSNAVQKGSGLSSYPDISEELKRVSGTNFDTAFLHAVVARYQRAIDYFANAQDALPADSTLKIWLGKLLPIFRQDLAVASQLMLSIDNRMR
jgi:putative membrane protein